MKIARKWDDMNYEDQIDYLKRHRKSRLQLMPSSELNDIRRVMGGFNKMTEGKEYQVKQQFNEWIQKLKDLGFDGEITENNALLEKDELIAMINVNKGKMKYYAHFEIKPILSKAASLNCEEIIDSIIQDFVN